MPSSRLFPNLFLALVALFLCAGCAGNQISKNMASWQGSHIDEVTSAWGDPSECVTTQGQTVCSWGNVRPTALENYSAGNSSALAVRSRPTCLKMLAMDDAGIVTGWRWRGDRCPDSVTVANVD